MILLIIALIVITLVYFFKWEEEKEHLPDREKTLIPHMIEYRLHRDKWWRLKQGLVDAMYADHVNMYGDESVKRISFLGRIWRLKQVHGDVEMIYIKAIKKKPVFMNKSRWKSLN